MSMNITIAITFKSRGIKIQRRGTFQKRGRSSEKVACDWIKEIKKEMEIDEIIKVTKDEGEVITDKVKELL